MTTFYEISHNTAHTRGVPEIEKIVKGLIEDGRCARCGRARRYPCGDLYVRLGKTRAKFWPDAIACGDYPCFVVSERFVRAMQERGVRLEIGGKVQVVETNPSGLSLDEAATYYWIDGQRHLAGKMDFEASGFVDVQFCEGCGYRTDDISQTYRRRHADPPPPTTFDYNAGRGYELFTTDLSPTAFFCTSRVLDCARQHKLMNIAFCAVDRGAVAEPVKY